MDEFIDVTPFQKLNIIQVIREAETLDKAFEAMNGIAANGWLRLWDELNPAKKIQLQLELDNQKLREALSNYVKSGWGDKTDFYKQAEAHGMAELLLATPSQSLVEHDNEVIERCAKEVDLYQYGDVTGDDIRELKGKP